MDNDRHLLVSRRAQPMVQKTLSLLVRAGLSSVPLAALVWDLGQLSVDLANERVTTKFLDCLAERIERLEQSTAATGAPHLLGEAAAYAARESLNRLVLETSEAFAADLARAVAGLESADAESEEARRQFARLVAAVGKHDIVYLGAIFRMNKGKATEKELELLAKVEPSPHFSVSQDAVFDYQHALIYVLSHHLPSLDPKSVLDGLARLGLITKPTIRRVGSELNQTDLSCRVTPLGEDMLGLFYEDAFVLPIYSELA